jgi:hypothetical protein
MKVLVIALLLLICSPVMAQGELDLPIPPVDIHSDKRAPGNGEEDGDRGDDPKDTPPPVMYGEELESVNDTIIYVMDISCSMDWGKGPYVGHDGQISTGTRMKRAKTELQKSIMALSENFYFNVIAYDCGVLQWQPEMMEANLTNKTSAVNWAHVLTPRGATGTGPATAKALWEKENMMVVLLTDGEPNCGANGTDGHRRMISTANTQGATINVFGIAAQGKYRAFCQAVASDSGGSYYDVP